MHFKLFPPLIMHQALQLSLFLLMPSITAPSTIALSTSQSRNNVKTVPAQKMLDPLETCFPGDMSHSHYKCHIKCMSLSPLELRNQKQMKFTFNHNWVFAEFAYCKQAGFHWLVFSEQSRGMFCILCNKHATQNLHKSKTYGSKAATRFWKLAVEEHAGSNHHQAAVTAEMLSWVSVFHQEYVNQVTSREEVLKNVFRACYFLAQHEMSNQKMIPFLESKGTLRVTTEFFWPNPGDIRVNRLELAGFYCTSWL